MLRHHGIADAKKKTINAKTFSLFPFFSGKANNRFAKRKNKIGAKIMNKQMPKLNRRMLPVIILLVLLAIAMLAFIWATLDLSSLDQIFLPDTGAGGRTELELRQSLIITKVILTSLNVGISAILLTIYTRIYLQTKMKFSIGLIVFSLGMLFNGIISDPLFFHRAQRVIGIPVMAETLFIFLALISILYVSLK